MGLLVRLTYTVAVPGPGRRDPSTLAAEQSQATGSCGMRPLAGLCRRGPAPDSASFVDLVRVQPESWPAVFVDQRLLCATCAANSSFGIGHG